MSMSKRHYEKVAAELDWHVHQPDIDTATVESIAHGLATIFAADNPRFDRARFMEASGLDAHHADDCGMCL